MSKVLRLWITEENMVLTEIEYVLREAGKHLHQGRGLLKHLPVPTKTPAELMAATRPSRSAEDELIPGP